MQEILPASLVGGASEVLVRARLVPDATRQDCGLDDLRVLLEQLGDDAEPIVIEFSYKYHPEEFAELAHRAGFAVVSVWTDEERTTDYLLAGVAAALAAASKYPAGTVAVAIIGIGVADLDGLAPIGVQDVAGLVGARVGQVLGGRYHPHHAHGDA